ncbi:39S ribosomal protein L52, mitochondrial [Trichoplusia ni]|uniref:Large ribosomal subunit protein mL52 n=1 Tax=Trichoplusia ni TaxID=7111 RepID=A0A7E5VZJ3_TRINI|nr:39S ribosomal protein L52, mitochondrial [Trichoplusia ni]
MSIILKNTATLLRTQITYRSLSTTQVVCLKEWREERGLPRNRNAEGLLTDGPDFTYLDGRPTPLLKKQKKRMLLQRENASRIVELISELDFAKERYQKMEADKEQERRNIIANRLKPKGAALARKK